MGRSDIAALCRPRSSAVVSVGVPAVFPPSENSTEPKASEPVEYEIDPVYACREIFGTSLGFPARRYLFPTLFPTLASGSGSIWTMIDAGFPCIEVIVGALLRVGYSEEAAWRIAEHDKYAFQFYRDVIHCRERICEYQSQRISYIELLGTVTAFCFKNLCRAWRGSIISKEFLNLDSLDKVAGAGLEPAALRL